MTSGARNDSMCLRRLLRLIIRRYKSFKSDAAKRPPSSGTKGRKSGGMTGNTLKIIHSGRLPLSLNSSIVLIRRTNLPRSASLCVSFNWACKAGISLSKSIPSKSVLIAGAPMPTFKRAPRFLRSSRTCGSVSNVPFLSSTRPVTGSTQSSNTI